MKPVLPIYNINTLNESKPSLTDFMADHFAHYLDEHRNLHFPHKHSFYQLVYFSEGSGSHSIDFINFPVRKGDIYFMIPGQVHSWDFKKMPDGFIINFSDRYINELLINPRYLDQFSFFSGSAGEQVISIPAKERNQIEQLLGEIVKEAQSDLDGKDDLIRTSLIQLFIRIARLSPRKNQPEQGNYNQVLLRNFQKLIDEHYKSKKLTRDYAAILYITPNHLNALCKDVSGRPAGELIRDRILLEAKRLLVNARMSITEIAFDLNFQDSSYFTKFFKKYEGVTPEAFRKNL